jgi:predicted porin
MRLFTFFVFFALLLSKGHAQFVLSQVNVRQAGMGNTRVLSNDAFASLYNPSAFNTNSKLNIGLSYSPSPFITGIQDIQIGSQFQFKNNFIGLGLISSGSKLYKEQLIGINYAKGFSNWLVGGRINILSINQSDINYGNSTKLTASIGTNVKVKPKLIIAAYINHLNQATFDKAKQEKVATTFVMGFKYAFSKNLQTIVEAEKNFVSLFNVKAGLEYNFQKLFFIRAGFQTYPIRPTIGLGFNYNSFTVNYSYQNQSVLGGMHAIGLSFDLANLNK